MNTYFIFKFISFIFIMIIGTTIIKPIQSGLYIHNLATVRGKHEMRILWTCTDTLSIWHIVHGNADSTDILAREQIGGPSWEFLEWRFAHLAKNFQTFESFFSFWKKTAFFVNFCPFCQHWKRTQLRGHFDYHHNTCSGLPKELMQDSGFDKSCKFKMLFDVRQKTAEWKNVTFHDFA